MQVAPAAHFGRAVWAWSASGCQTLAAGAEYVASDLQNRRVCAPPPLGWPSMCGGQTGMFEILQKAEERIRLFGRPSGRSALPTGVSGPDGRPAGRQDRAVGRRSCMPAAVVGSHCPFLPTPGPPCALPARDSIIIIRWPSSSSASQTKGWTRCAPAWPEPARARPARLTAHMPALTRPRALQVSALVPAVLLEKPHLTWSL